MFIIKKIISPFLFPLPLILWISFIGLFLLWFTKKQKTGKVFVSVGVCLMLLLSSNFIARPLLRTLEKEYPLHRTQLSHEACTTDEGYQVKFVVVLGGGHISDKNLPFTSQLNRNTTVRLMEGIRLYRKCIGSKLILSGGSVFDPTAEAEIMAQITKELGVNHNDIITESLSKDTNDEVELIKPVVNNDHFILVTSAAHMPRSMAMFRKRGMNPVAAPTDHLAKSTENVNPFSFFPDADSLQKSERVFYENMGLVWARIRGQI